MADSYPNFHQVLKKIYDSIRTAIRITPADEMVDPTGRIRTSLPETLFSNKNIHSKNDSIIKEKTSGSSTITYLPHESSVELETTDADGDSAIRQSRHISYVAGKGFRAQLTFGLGDDFDNIAFVLRSSTSGSVSDSNIVYQNDWNVDTLDGSGDKDINPSGILLDITKVQLVYIDGLWQGVGDVRVGFKIGGNIVICHVFKTANVENSVYYKRPSLPVRYEITNSSGITYSRIGYNDESDGVFFQATKTTDTSNILKEICCQVDSEGGYQIPGIEFSAPTAYYLRSGIGTTLTPIMAIRLKQTLASGKINRAIAKFVSLQLRVSGQDDAWVNIRHVHDPSFTGGTWTSANNDSLVEYNTGLTGVTSTKDHVIYSGPFSGGQGNKAQTAQAGDGIFNEHGLISMNIDGDESQAFVIYASALTTTMDISASIVWTEIE